MGLKNVLTPFNAWTRILGKPFTIPKDNTIRPGAERYRGWHVNDQDTCIGCGNCSDICQNSAIDMVKVRDPNKKDSGLRPELDYGRCCWCALCVDVCPSGSLGLSNDYVWVTEKPDDYRYIPGVDKKPWDEIDLGWRKTPDGSFDLLDYKRVPMTLLEGEERAKTWAEVVVGYTEEEARKEAARCAECGLCIAACPAHMHIPDYIAAIRDGDDQRAVELIYDNNAFPEMCGKVCTRRCETVCALSRRGDAVAIRWLKRFATERFDDLKKVITPQLEQVGQGKKVAIIGGGPGGITVAYYLALRGFQCTIFDALPKLGGATFFGIPKYRFPISSLDKQVDLLVGAGVEIKTNTRVDPEMFGQIQKDFDAIYIGTGLMKGSSLRAPGEDDPSVVMALDFLLEHHIGNTMDVGKSVVVVGGGNTAIDSARVSRRLGAEVTIAYRRREEDMPADNEEIEDAMDEAVALITQNIPLRVDKTPEGRLDYVWGPAEMVADKPGRRPKPVLIEGVENHIICDSIIVAVGQKPDLAWLPKDVLESVSNNWGGITVDEHGMSATAGIFAGGDLVNDTADAISAIADGLRAVEGIQRFILDK